MAEETLYLGRDNINDFLLKAENDEGVLVPWPLDGVVDDIGMDVTEIDAIFNADVTINSDDNENGPIMWAKTGYGVGEIRFDFSALEEADLTAGLYNVTIVVYDLSNTDGIVWGTYPVRAVSV
jgi:hypothetical protein